LSAAFPVQHGNTWLNAVELWTPYTARLILFSINLFWFMQFLRWSHKLQAEEMQFREWSSFTSVKQQGPHCHRSYFTRCSLYRYQ